MFIEILSGPFNCNTKFVVDKWNKEMMDGRNDKKWYTKGSLCGD